MRLHQFFAGKELADIEAEASATDNGAKQKDDTGKQHPVSDKGLKTYWLVRNKESTDGLPGIQTAYKSNTVFDRSIASKEWKQEKPPTDVLQAKATPDIAKWVDSKVLVGFVVGVGVTGLLSNLTSVVEKLKAW